MLDSCDSPDLLDEIEPDENLTLSQQLFDEQEALREERELEFEEAKRHKHLKSLSYSQILAEDRNRPPDLYADFIPSAENIIFGGDSAEGKSPFVIQLLLSAVAGKSFLGHRLRPGKHLALFVDYENGSHLDSLIEIIWREHLKMPGEPPENQFRVMREPELSDIHREIQSWAPSICAIDTMRGCAPDAPSKNELAAKWLRKMRNTIQPSHTSHLFMHHLRKPGEFGAKEGITHLADDDVVHWMKQIEGSSSLVNQPFCRIGIQSHTIKTTKLELVVKANFKGLGDQSTIFLGRKRNDSGQPTGYYRIDGPQIMPSYIQKIHTQLLATFPSPTAWHFSDAEKIAGSPKATNLAIRMLLAQHLACKVGRNRGNTHYILTQPTDNK